MIPTIHSCIDRWRWLRRFALSEIDAIDTPEPRRRGHSLRSFRDPHQIRRRHCGRQGWRGAGVVALLRRDLPLPQPAAGLPGFTITGTKKKRLVRGVMPSSRTARRTIMIGAGMGLITVFDATGWSAHARSACSRSARAHFWSPSAAGSCASRCRDPTFHARPARRRPARDRHAVIDRIGAGADKFLTAGPGVTLQDIKPPRLFAV